MRKTSRPAARRICEAVPRLGRREFLAGFAVALAAAPVAAQEPRTRISDLANEDGVASRAARLRIGEDVVLRGYMAPALRKGVLCDLFERPASPCPACALFHNAGATVAIVGEALPAEAGLLRLVEVGGVVGVDARGKTQIVLRSVRPA